MNNITILWVDDEIDLLKPHIIFLQSKGYEIATSNNGNDAIDMVDKNNYDLIFLDENMPGLSGLETLSAIKNIKPSIPVIMITKSEEEYIMDEAIGSRIADYLIKPVNPMQILMAIKKITDKKRLVTEKTSSNYQTVFRNLSMNINDASSYADWVSIYKKIVFWELELENSNAGEMNQILEMQKSEANNEFARFIKKNYTKWFEANTDNVPLMSPGVFKNLAFPKLDSGNRTAIFVIDNLRYDQWLVIKPLLRELFIIDKEDIFMSILPTATQFARNAMFAGLMPADIERIHPEYWVNEGDEEGKNKFEAELLQKQMNRLGVNRSLYYEKIQNIEKGRKLVSNSGKILSHDLSVIVINFVDMLSHARTEMDMIRELANDEKAYRSLTLSWFENSTLYELLKILAQKKVNVMITTDHGTTRVHNPVKVVGDKDTSTNLRYKHGKSLSCKAKDVLEINNPNTIRLPKINVSSTYLFAQSNDFFAYPNNYNHYVSYYKNTFQHGGISMEEMLIPFVSLKAK